jgi:hypothetical protein
MLKPSVQNTFVLQPDHPVSVSGKRKGNGRGIFYAFSQFEVLSEGTVHTCMHAYTHHTYIHTCTHAHIHTHTHLHTYIPKEF